MSSHQTIVFIAGGSKTGAALLDLILSASSKVSTLGDVGLLHVFANQNNHQRPVCGCGKDSAHCSFWHPVEDELARMLGAPSGGVFKNYYLRDPERISFEKNPDDYKLTAFYRQPRFFHAYRFLSMVVGSLSLFEFLANRSRHMRKRINVAENRRKLYQAVSRAYHKPIIVDSTGDPAAMKEAWIERRGAETKFIILKRNGLAVTADLCRHLNISMKEATKLWLLDQLKWYAALYKIDKKSQFHLRYEDLRRAPEPEIRKLCAFLDVPFEEKMLSFKTECHALGSYDLLQSLKQKELSPDDETAQFLKPEEKAYFQRYAGWLNRRLGYR